VGPARDYWGSGEMASTDVTPETREGVTGTETVAEDVCLACAHPWARHDVISARYCTATITGALTRGCVCPADRTP
jgi:hypothetical protein